TAILNTCNDLMLIMAEVRSIVRTNDREIKVSQLRSLFKDTLLNPAADTSDWQIFIDEFRGKRSDEFTDKRDGFSGRRSAGVKNVVIALLHRRTGLSMQTVTTYTRKARQQ